MTTEPSAFYGPSSSAHDRSGRPTVGGAFSLPKHEIAPSLGLAPRFAKPVIIAGAWTLIGLFNVTKDYFEGIAHLGRMQTRGEVALTFESMIVWAAFTPVIFALAERFPVERGRVLRRLALHAVFAVALAGIDAMVDHLVEPLVGPRYRRALLQGFVGESFINLYSYYAVLGIGLALRYHRLWHERRIRVLRLETELAEANLEALERQLRPHFLYNTLHTIGALVRTERGPEAVRVVAMLGDLLRHVLQNREGHEVPLERELDFARQYLAIEEVRFGEKLRVRIDVDEGARDAQVPRFLLQPLVENAVTHGLESESGGEVAISVFERAGELCIEVRDPGRGELHGRRRDGDGIDPSSGNGIGLTTTRARLASLYGAAQKLELVDASHTSSGGAGTVVRITLPFRRISASARSPAAAREARS